MRQYLFPCIYSCIYQLIEWCIYIANIPMSRKQLSPATTHKDKILLAFLLVQFISDYAMDNELHPTPFLGYESNFAATAQACSQRRKYECYTCKITATSPRGIRVNRNIRCFMPLFLSQISNKVRDNSDRWNDCVGVIPFGSPNICGAKLQMLP